jgi:HSP20 family protein
MNPPRRSLRAPLSEMAILQREINELFERLSLFDRDEPEAGHWCPSLDVYECRGALQVVIEVPGLAPDSLRVSVKDGALVIVGDRRERRPGAETAFLCMERPQGRFTRRIALDMAVDIGKAEARLAGGLLTISVPRLKDRRGRESVIPVRRERDE